MEDRTIDTVRAEQKIRATKSLFLALRSEHNILNGVLLELGQPTVSFNRFLVAQLAESLKRLRLERGECCE